MSIFQNIFLQQIAQGDSVKDWQHASKLFVANNYELTPKSAFLYYVHFELNPLVTPNSPKVPDSSGGGDLGMSTIKNQTELGMLVKQVSLPKYMIETKTLNAYNRPHIIQNKIIYDPVNITFHDDSANRVRNFWYDYYTYYYRNSDPDNVNLGAQSHNEITSPRNIPTWGYTVRNTGINNTTAPPYLSSISIYSLFNKKFSEYILYNPIIKSFAHGEHTASDGTGTMSHQMVVEYESVSYAYGSVTPDTVTGFADKHYDLSPSPILPLGGGTQSILGPGGIISEVASITNDVGTGNFAAAALSLARDKNGLSGANLSTMVKQDALTSLKGSLAGNNPFSSISIPGLGSF
jgi:hypothetical protein